MGVLWWGHAPPKETFFTGAGGFAASPSEKRRFSGA